MRAHRSDCGWFWTWAAVGAGLVLSFIGIFSVGPFLIPFVTLLLGVAATRRPHTPTILAGAAIVTACAVAALSVSPAAGAVLAVAPLSLAAFALAVAGRLDAEAAGALTGAGLAAVLLGGPPACLLLVAAGLAAFPLLRASAGPQPLSR